MTSSLNLINWVYLLPETLVLTNLLILCIFEIIFPKVTKIITLSLCLICLLGSLFYLTFEWVQISEANSPIFSFFESFETDPVTIIFRILIILSTLFSILFSFDYIQSSTKLVNEFLILILTACLGSMLLSGANNLVLVFIGLETLSLSSYLLTAYTKLDIRSNEAALKFFSLGGVSSSILLYGFSLLYGLSKGHLNFYKINEVFLTIPDEQKLAFTIPIIFLLIGIGFKLSLVPFHQWTPDVYEGAPTPVVAFLSIGSKAGVLCFTIRVLNLLFGSQVIFWKNLIEIFAILSLIIGNFSALSQRSFKRFLAYSSIGQIGFLLIGLVVGTEDGYSSLIFYLLVYLFTNFGVFACIILYSLKTGKDKIQDYSGLATTNPLFAFCLSLCLLSLAGLPPLAGFFSKLYIFLLGWESHHYILTITALLTSLISVFYYLRIIKIMIIPESPTILPKLSLLSYDNLSTFGIGLFICTLGSLGFGFFGQTFLSLAEKSISLTYYL